MKKDIPCIYLACAMENSHTKSIVVIAKSRKDDEEEENQDDGRTHYHESKNIQSGNICASNESILQQAIGNQLSSYEGIHQTSHSTATIAQSEEAIESNGVASSNTNKKRKKTHFIEQGENKYNDDGNEKNDMDTGIIQEIQVKKVRKKKRKKHHYRPIIKTTCLLPCNQKVDQHRCGEINQCHRSIDKGDHKTFLPQHKKLQYQQSTEENESKSLQTLLPMIVTPKEALEKNKDKDIQIQIHVKPLLVLDINGILCHRVREKDIPSNLLAKLLEYFIEEHKCDKAGTNINHNKINEENVHVYGQNDISSIQNDATIQQNTNGDSTESLPTSFGSSKKGLKPTTESRIKQICRTIYRNAIGHIARTPIIPRTDLHDLLYYLDQHYTLAIWSSAKRKTVKGLVRILFPEPIASRLLFVWHQSKCECVPASTSTTTASASNAATALTSTREDQKLSVSTSNNYKNNINMVKLNGCDNANQQSSNPTSPNNKIIDVQRKSHHDNLIWVKYLSKVWASFPLWNESNTILIDDSPDKCPEKYKNNAVFPPPITGLDTSMLHSILPITPKVLLPSLNTCSASFDVPDPRSKLTPMDVIANDDRIEVNGVTFSDHDNELKQRDFFEKLTALYLKDEAVDEGLHTKLLDFLEQNASGHMGWRKSVK